MGGKIPAWQGSDPRLSGWPLLPPSLPGSWLRLEASDHQGWEVFKPELLDNRLCCLTPAPWVLLGGLR